MVKRVFAAYDNREVAFGVISLIFTAGLNLLNQMPLKDEKANFHFDISDKNKNDFHMGTINWKNIEGFIK